MDPITALGMLNTAAGMVSNDSDKQQKYTLELMDRQADYNKQAAREQEAASLRMFEATGYGAKIKQLKKAGLNPSLIYGMGAAGGGTTGNITAAQVSQGGAPNVAASTANKNQSVAMMLQLNKLQSEIDLNKSAAEANRAAAGEKTAQVPKIEADTESVKLDNSIKKIDLEIAENGKFANMEKIGYLAKQSEWDFRKKVEEWRSQVYENKITQATLNTRIEQYEKNLQKTAAEIIVAKTNAKVNNERATQIINEISQAWMNARSNAKNADVNEQEMQERIWKTLQDNGAAMEREDTRGLYNIIETIIGAALLRSGGKAPIVPIGGFGSK